MMVSSLVSAAYGDGRRPFMAVVELLPIPRPDRPIDVKKQFAIAIWRDDGIDAVGLEVFVRLKDAFIAASRSHTGNDLERLDEQMPLQGPQHDLPDAIDKTQVG